MKKIYNINTNISLNKKLDNIKAKHKNNNELLTIINKRLNEIKENNIIEK